MKHILLLAAVAMAGCARPEALPVTGEINVIPQPMSIKRIGGAFELNTQTVIAASSDEEVKAAEILAALIQGRTELPLPINGNKNATNAIVFTRLDSSGDVRGDSAYRLRIAPGRIDISGTGRGMFYAVQSLIQQIRSGTSLPFAIPAAEIDDRPRFEYRGMHLDVARHFMPVEFIKQYIDHLARYKLNYFHWHLTDDQGWRIEIKQYPLLTKNDSWRPESALSKSNETYRGNGRPVSGVYSQEQIREIVEHARSRYVTIVPEIDMPGHASAALAAYPEFGCRGPNHPYKIKTAWGAFPDILCPTPETFTFVENVLTEVIDLFPDSPYIHIGGDEVIFHDQWRASDAVRQLKATEGLSTERDVEAYFIRRVVGFLNSRGRKAIGWDEVIDQNQSSEMMVMAWQGADRGQLAATKGHKVIMAPMRATYFDYSQGDPNEVRLAMQPPVTLDAVYRFEPAPQEFGPAAQNVIGGQACLWTEFIYTPADAEYMLFPRLLALSEALWSMPERKDINYFSSRLSLELGELDRVGTQFFIPIPFGFGDRRLRPQDRAVLDLMTPVDGSVIRYTIDGSEPVMSSAVYQRPMVLEVGTIEPLVVKLIVQLPSGRQSRTYEAAFTRGYAGVPSGPPARSQRFEPPPIGPGPPTPGSQSSPKGQPPLPPNTGPETQTKVGNSKPEARTQNKPER